MVDIVVLSSRLIKSGRNRFIDNCPRPLATAFQYQPIGASFKLIYTCLVSRYSSMPQGPSSRPKPDCLYPPHGASTYVGCMWFTQTIPARRAFTERMALKMSRVQTAAANP